MAAMSTSLRAPARFSSPRGGGEKAGDFQRETRRRLINRQDAIDAKVGKIRSEKFDSRGHVVPFFLKLGSRQRAGPLWDGAGLLRWAMA